MNRSQAERRTPTPRRRLLSWAWDYLVILAWLALVFLVVGVPAIFGWVDLDAVWNRQLSADLAITLLTVIPFSLYLVVTEAGPSHATWGKRRAGLAVSGGIGGNASRGRVMVRNLVKVLPWQLGHLSASRFAQGEASAAATAFYALSMVLLLAIALPPLWGRRGLHDSLAGTAVVSM